MTDESGHHLSEQCWCLPTIEIYENGLLVIHNDAWLPLSRVWWIN